MYKLINLIVLILCGWSFAGEELKMEVTFSIEKKVVLSCKGIASVSEVKEGDVHVILWRLKVQDASRFASISAKLGGKPVLVSVGDLHAEASVGAHKPLGILMFRVESEEIAREWITRLKPLTETVQ